MNFQDVEQANGNKISMSGTFIEIGCTQFTPQQKAKAICKISDTVGVSHKVHIYQGTGQLPLPANLNQLSQFTISTFQGNYKGKPYTGYSGFWNSNAQAGQNTPQDTPKSPQPPAQATTPPKTQSNAPTWQVLDREHVQKDVICALLASRKRPEPKEVKIWVDYIMEGVHPDSKPQGQTNPDWVGENPPPTDENGVPF